MVLREPTNVEKKLLQPKETVGIALNVNNTSGGISANEVANGSYVLNTSGNDPWIRSKPIEVPYDTEKSYIISFEYKTETAYNELEIFYGPPITGTQKLSAGELPASSDWSTFTINPRLLIDNFQDSDWTDFCFDFGKNENATKTIEVRNIKIRKPTAEELEAEKTSDKFGSKIINQEFISYLNTTFTDSVSMVKVAKEIVSIKGTVENTSEELFLAEIEPHQYGFDQTEFNFVSPIIFEEDKFSVEVPRFLPKGDHDYDRLYSRWAVVRKTGENTYELTSNAQWAEDISAIASTNIEEVKASSIKGLDGLGPSTIGNFNDLVDLDIKSMKLNLLLNGVFSLNPSGITHEFNGKTYNISPRFVEGFDARIKRTTDAGIKNAFVLLIPININNEDLKRIFVHPDASLGLYSMANVATAEGVEYYAAMVDFLAERYSRPDKKYGRLDQWIIHNEVDAHTSWTHAGQKPVELYTEIYDRSMRMVHYTIRKHNPTAKVFASFTKHWNSVAGSSANFKSKDILETQIKLTQKEGDYEWNIAWHSYPTNLFDPTVWNDPPAKTQFNFDTPEITPKNLEMIDAYVRQKEVLYNGKKVRTILLSENGFSSNAARNANANETTQAAALAYFWKKANKRLPSIENIQLHRWVDNPNEAGLLFGLWTVLEGTNDGFDKKKEGWYVWEAAGTSMENAVLDPYKSVIGISDWSEIYQDVPTEVTPYKVDFSIANCDADLDGIQVNFNGEHKIPQENGSVSFYNVASNVDQPYTITKQGNTLASDTLAIDSDLELTLNLAAITNFKAKGISSSQIKLSWESQMPDIESYRIEAKSGSADFEERANVPGDFLTYIDEELISGAEYTYRIAAVFDNLTLSCYSEEIIVKAPFLTVDYKNGDRNGSKNNGIRPQLQLKNTADYPVDLENVTIRYWFTAEDYAPLNGYVDYAKIGNQNVDIHFVALPEARKGANYYAEYRFSSNVTLSAKANSGDIKSRIAKNDWTDFDEKDDYSYDTNTNYQQSDRITVYLGDKLIWGTEPELAQNQSTILEVLSSNNSRAKGNSIKVSFSIKNSGNQSVPLDQVTLRYWFTPESASALNAFIDYAELGRNSITTQFGQDSQTAHNFMEIGFDTTTNLYAFSQTGKIAARISKQDYSDFDQTDDHSYAVTNKLIENEKVTAYINGELVWGREPSGNNLMVETNVEAVYLLYPNPASDIIKLSSRTLINTVEKLKLVDYLGNIHELKASKDGKNLNIELPRVQDGVYLLKGKINGQSFTERLLIDQF